MKYAAISEKFNQFSKREKVLVTSTALVLLVTLMYTLFIEGLLTNANNAQRQLQNMRSMQTKIEQQLNQTQQSLQLNPSEAINAKIGDSQALLQTLENELQQSNIQVASPEQLYLFNQKISAPDIAIKFQSVQFDTLEFQHDDLDEDSTAHLSKCETKLQIEGSKQQLFDYLAFLEKQPIGIYWNELEYQQLNDKQVQLSLEFYLLCAN